MPPITENNGEAHSSELERWLIRLREGDAEARDALIALSQVRLYKLAHKMLRRDFPRVARWEESDDIRQRANLKLRDALPPVLPNSVRAYVGLASTIIRRILIDLARHYYGPQGLARRHQSPNPDDPGSASRLDDLERWTNLHEAIAGLPDAEREVFDLRWYHGLTHREAAEALGTTIDIVKDRWQKARLRLYTALEGKLPPV